MDCTGQAANVVGVGANDAVVVCAFVDVVIIAVVCAVVVVVDVVVVIADFCIGVVFADAVAAFVDAVVTVYCSCSRKGKTNYRQTGNTPNKYQSYVFHLVVAVVDFQATVVSSIFIYDFLFLVYYFLPGISYILCTTGYLVFLNLVSRTFFSFLLTSYRISF